MGNISSKNFHLNAVYPNLPKIKQSLSARPVSEMERVLEEREKAKVGTDILDEAGRKLAGIEYDSRTGDIIAIRPERYVNVEGVAEQLDEKIYVMDEAGDITPERLTRVEAREREKPYLVVTTLVFHGDNMLVQKRSLQKKLDAGKSSTSAHGVAKEVFDVNRKRIMDGRVAALINSGLELNEELRHDADPFTVRVWPGTHEELFLYAEAKGLDDSNTVWLVPEAYLPDDGYSLGWKSDSAYKRTRALSSGRIFSLETPAISIDPAELQGVEWRKPSEVFKDSGASEDLPKVTMVILKNMWKVTL